MIQDTSDSATVRYGESKISFFAVLVIQPGDVYYVANLEPLWS